MKRIRIYAAVAAAAALAVVIWRIGWAEIAAQLVNLRLTLPIVILAGAVRLLLQTRAWGIALRAEGIQAPQLRLVAVRLASLAAGYVAALGPVVSEPAKVMMLRHPAGSAAVAAATLVETGTYWFTTVILGLLGVCAAAFLLAEVRVVWAGAAIFGVCLVLLVTRRSVLSPLIPVARGRAPKWLKAAETAELRMRSFRDRQPRAAGRVLALDSIAQLVTVVEVGAVLWAMGIRASIFEVVAIEAAGRIVKILGAWIPGRIGADEGGAVASFALFGLAPAAGLVLAVARRIRDVLWCAAGVLWAAASTGRREEPSRAASQPLFVEER